MDKLPEELYELIADQLEVRNWDDDLLFPPLQMLAAVSRRWQSVVERRNFRHIWLTDETFDDFEAAFGRDAGSGNARRRQYLKFLDFTVSLPKDNNIRPKFHHDLKFEDEHNRRINDEAFSKAIHRLLHILSSWEVSPSSPPSVGLIIGSVYSSDTRPQIGCSNGHTCGCPERSIYSHLQLLDTETLPVVPVITSLRLKPRDRRICSDAALLLSTRLPNLRTARWWIDSLDNEGEVQYPCLRVGQRSRLTAAVRKHLPKLHNLESFWIESSTSGEFRNTKEEWRPPNLAGGGPTPDPLSTALREATSTMSSLESLYITGTLDASLLWPAGDPAKGITTPFWQNLSYLTVRLTNSTPSGDWLFPPDGIPSQQQSSDSLTDLPPGYRGGDEDLSIDHAMGRGTFTSMTDYTRLYSPLPKEALMNPLLLSFAHACAQIPGLRRAAIHTQLPAYHHLPTPLRALTSDQFYDRCRLAFWGVIYAAPNTSFNFSSHNSDHVGGWWFHEPEDRGALYAPVLQENPTLRGNLDRRRIIWDVADWKPRKEVLEAMRNIGREQHGEEDVVENFVSSFAGTPGLRTTDRAEPFFPEPGWPVYSDDEEYWN